MSEKITTSPNNLALKLRYENANPALDGIKQLMDMIMIPPSTKELIEMFLLVGTTERNKSDSTSRTVIKFFQNEKFSEFFILLNEDGNPHQIN